MKLGITGAGGRMGRALVEAIAADGGLALAAALDARGAAVIGQEVGGVKVGSDIEAALAACDVLIDFTRPDGTLQHVDACVRRGRPIVIGTTGFSDAQLGAIREAGKRIAIPSRFAVDLLFLRKLLARENMTPDQLEIIEMPPPDMPAALYADAVDAYCTGEPFGAAAQRAGYARPLRMTRDEWPNYICCVLTVREELIQANRPMVQDLVNHVLGAGAWLDARRENRDKAAEIAAGREFFNQDPNIIRFVMDNPEDRVTYGDLRMIRSEFEELMQLSIEAGTIKRPIPYESYVDESFARNAQPAAIPI